MIANMGREMTHQDKDAERKGLIDRLNRSRRAYDGGQDMGQGRSSWGGRSMTDRGRPLGPQGSGIDYHRIGQVVREILGEHREPLKPVGEPLFIGPKEMAKRLEISERTLREWTRTRRIPFLRIGPLRGRSIVRFKVADVETALAKWQTKSV